MWNLISKLIDTENRLVVARGGGGWGVGEMGELFLVFLSLNKSKILSTTKLKTNKPQMV